ncbi:hypothetical protein [Marinobacter salicampi]|uniref:hypothetical protein n=1 Tax=Marinobacter salicampi TaxID=435907 RepID=UPI00140B1F27|nr:hypothetical protein [Marinobacter salicampi]
MKNRVNRRLIGLLITIFLVVQPIFAFAQVMPDNTQVMPDNPMSPVAAKEASNSHAHAMHSATAVDMEEGMACGGMAQQDCSIASSGACSGLFSALVSQDLLASFRLTSDQVPSVGHHRYISVVLDSLTPPPDSLAV